MAESIVPSSLASSTSRLAELTESDLERISCDIATVTGLISSILDLVKEINEVDVGGIQALCEKAGYLSDRCAQGLGQPVFCGSLESWARLDWGGH